MKNTKANILKLLKMQSENLEACIRHVSDEYLENMFIQESITINHFIGLLENEEYFNEIYEIFNK